MGVARSSSRSRSVGTEWTSWAVAGDRVFPEVFDFAVRHAVKVIVAGIILPHVFDAEHVVLTITTPTLWGLVPARFSASLPFANGRRRLPLCLRGARALVTADADAIEVF